MLQALAYFFTAMPFVVAALIGLLLPACGLLLYRRFEAGVLYVFLVFTLDAALFGGSRFNLGINLYPLDLGYGLLALVAAMRWLAARDMPQRSWLWMLSVALFALALGVGLALNGRRAGVQARDIFYAMACASYAMSFRITELQVRRLLHAFAACGVVLLMVCAYRWVTYYLPISELLPVGGEWSGDGPTRVIPSNEAMLLCQWLVLGLAFPALSAATGLARWMSPLLLAVVIVLQHRSVWIAGGVGLLTALLATRAHHASRAMQLAVLVMVGTMVALPAMYSDSLSGLSREIGKSAATAVAGQGTVHARLQDWRFTMADFARAGPQTWLTGYGFGRDTTRKVVNERGETQTIAFGAHNHYIALLTTNGLFGLATFLAVVALTAWRLYRRCGGAHAGQMPAVLLVLLVMQLAYYIPYGSDPLQYFLLGTTMAYLATIRRDESALTPVTPIEMPQRPRAQDVAWR